MAGALRTCRNRSCDELSKPQVVKVVHNPALRCLTVALVALRRESSINFPNKNSQLAAPSYLYGKTTRTKEKHNTSPPQFNMAERLTEALGPVLQAGHPSLCLSPFLFISFSLSSYPASSHLSNAFFIRRLRAWFDSFLFLYITLVNIVICDNTEPFTKMQ